MTATSCDYQHVAMTIHQTRINSKLYLEISHVGSYSTALARPVIGRTSECQRCSSCDPHASRQLGQGGRCHLYLLGTRQRNAVLYCAAEGCRHARSDNLGP